MCYKADVADYPYRLSFRAGHELRAWLRAEARVHNRKLGDLIRILLTAAMREDDDSLGRETIGKIQSGDH